MDISSRFTVAIKSELLKSTTNKIIFKPGSTIRLKIIELNGDRALIDFGGFRATAEIKIPVTLGDELHAKVLEFGKQLKLGVLNVEPKNFSSTERLLNRPETATDDIFKKLTNDLRQILDQTMKSHGDKSMPLTIRNTLMSLYAHFEPFELKEITTQLMPRIQAFVENSGVFLEKTLERIISSFLEDSATASKKSLHETPEIKTVFMRDLKANLLMLQQLSEDKEVLKRFFSPSALSNLKSIIATLLADITQQQGRVVNQMNAGDPFQFFTYDLPLKEGEQTAKLRIYYDKKRKSGSKKGFQISLLLSLDRLGDIRTDFLLLGNDLVITFFVSEESTKAKIQENFLDPQEILGSFFDQIQFKVMVSKKKVKDFMRVTVQETNENRIDLRI